MRFATFRIGPEPGGRGYKILASHGLDRGGGWTGNVPLVLLDWAKWRSPVPFAGRFPVAGGALILRARYEDEGSAGQIAFANGVFIAESDLARACANERAILAAISFTADFGLNSLELPDAAFGQTAVQAWPGLGLAWEDRQIFIAGDHSLEEVALTALDSIAPREQRPRVRGWCTTARLASRGDFLPIENCNLLVSTAQERKAGDRFKACHIDEDGQFTGDMIDEPPAYTLWRRILEAEQGNLSEASNVALASAWSLGMAHWADAAIAWHLLETISRQGESFATMVEAIVVIGKIAGDAVCAAMVDRYLHAMAGQPAPVVSGLVARLDESLAAFPQSRGAVDSYLLESNGESLARESGDQDLMRLARAMVRHAEGGEGEPEKIGLAARRLAMLEDRASRLGVRNEQYFELRGAIAIVHHVLGDLSGPRAVAPTRQEAHRFLGWRTTMPLRRT